MTPGSEYADVMSPSVRALLYPRLFTTRSMVALDAAYGYASYPRRENPNCFRVTRPLQISRVASAIVTVVRFGWETVWPPISFPAAAMVARLFGVR